tara:strand:- start:95 stop:529 length:435 start_codon:yes stop_codon:yes gene_type:complete
MARKKKPKNRKKIKKYLQGGDLRDASSSVLPDDPFGAVAADMGGGDLRSNLSGVPSDDGNAIGQVRAISRAAGRVGDYLSTAGQAIGEGQSDDSWRSSNTAGVFRKGGKVKKSAKKAVSGKARGVGRAVKKKVRPAKMVKMKRS